MRHTAIGTRGRFTRYFLDRDKRPTSAKFEPGGELSDSVQRGTEDSLFVLSSSSLNLVYS